MKEENDNKELIINDEETINNNKLKQSSSFKKKLLIFAAFISICLIILYLTIIIVIKSKNKGEELSEKEILGEIKCIYEISDSDTQILSQDFKKESEMDILINGQKLENFTNFYKFSKSGEYEINFVFMKILR